MKLSTTVALTLAVTTAAFSSLAGSSQAASITVNGVAGTSVTVDSTQDYLFEFVSSKGSFQSNFIIPPSATITEAAPGFIQPIQGDFEGTCTVCSVVSKITVPYFILQTVAANPGDVVPFEDYSNGGVSYGGAKIVGDAGFFTISWNDRFQPDADFNDFVVTAKAVPVPAIVPGIALAGAFLGSKALKRKKNEASKASA